MDVYQKYREYRESFFFTFANSAFLIMFCYSQEHSTPYALFITRSTHSTTFNTHSDPTFL